MSRRRALMAILTVSVAALSACSTNYEPSRDQQGGYSSAAASTTLDGRVTGPTGARIQTGNLPSG